MFESRIDALSNGHVELTPAPEKRATPRKRKHAKVLESKPRRMRPADLRAKLWCSVYVTAALALSAYLNGYANASFVENKLAGWCMGIAIPLFVFVLFKAAGWMHKQGNSLLALAAAGFGTVLLFLSVADCQQALSMLTHTPAAWLSWAFAITIDCGFVTCELGAMGVLLRK